MSIPIPEHVGEMLDMLDCGFPGLSPASEAAAAGRALCWALALEPYTTKQVSDALPKVLRSSKFPTPADFVDSIEGPMVKRPTYETDLQGGRMLDRPAGWVETRGDLEPLDTGQEPLALPDHLEPRDEEPPEDEDRGGPPRTLSSLFAEVLDRRGIPRPPGLAAEVVGAPAARAPRPGRARGFEGGRTGQERAVLDRLEWECRLKRGANPGCPHCLGTGQVSRLDGTRLAPELSGAPLIASYAERSVFACICAAAVPREI